VAKAPAAPKAIVFALGVFCGALIAFSRNKFPPTAAPVDGIGPPISLRQAWAGGFIIASGARMAGDCTSGHGISGLSALSFSSLVTVMAIFGGGIFAASVL
jgi:uncharacterized protein